MGISTPTFSGVVGFKGKHNKFAEDQSNHEENKHDNPEEDFF